MHRLKLRLDLRDRLQIEPPEDRRAGALFGLFRFLKTCCEGVLHNVHQGALSCFGHVLRHVLDDGILRQGRLEIHV